MQTVTENEAAGTVSFHAALLEAEAQARSTLAPALHERLSAAVALVTDGRVFQTSAGAWQVSSRSTAGRTYTVNGTCPCEDCFYNKPPQGLCKHRLAMFLSQRVLTLMHQPAAPVVPEMVEPWPEGDCDALTSTHAPEKAAAADVQAPHGIPAQHVVMIQGKAFVRFAGLLQLAHERGLVALTADWTYNDGELSLAHAVATFQDGRRFEESGDATPANTNRKVAVHFRRVALTRAKARVLRDALGVDLVAVEELADE